MTELQLLIILGIVGCVGLAFTMMAVALREPLIPTNPWTALLPQVREEVLSAYARLAQEYKEDSQ